MKPTNTETTAEYFDPLFKLREVETIIRAGRSTIYNLLKSGELNAVKRGGSTLVSRREIDRYLATAKPAVFRK